MATRPSKWRILAVLTGPSLEGSVGSDSTGLGCISEFQDLKDGEAEVAAQLSLKALSDPGCAVRVCSRLSAQAICERLCGAAAHRAE